MLEVAEIRHDGGRDGGAHIDGRLRCPVCGAVLDARLLDLEDEDTDSRETLLLFDCPQGHIHAALTQEDITAILAAEVRKHLGL